MVSDLLRTYSVKEAAQILKASPYTVRKYIKEGKLEAHKPGRIILITEQALKDYIAKNDK